MCLLLRVVRMIKYVVLSKLLSTVVSNIVSLISGQLTLRLGLRVREIGSRRD